MMNPFGPDDQERLYNVATAKTASADTENFLISVNVRREIAKKSLISECTKRPGRFEERIPKQKMQTFEIELERKTSQRSNGKVLTICFVRDLSCSLLRLSLEEKIDMEEVLSYPLTSVPL